MIRWREVPEGHGFGSDLSKPHVAVTVEIREDLVADLKFLHVLDVFLSVPGAHEAILARVLPGAISTGTAVTGIHEPEARVFAGLTFLDGLVPHSLLVLAGFGEG